MSKQLGLALFGIGKAGMIHLMNLLRIERAVIYYIVERDVDKAKDIVQKYHMRDSTVVSIDDASQVYQDDRLSVMNYDVYRTPRRAVAVLLILHCH